MTRVASAVLRPLGALVALSALFALSDCTLSAGGPSFVTLGVRVRGVPAGSAGSGASGETLTELCVRLPVLLGSSVDKSAAVTGGLSVKVHATRDDAVVTFPGADDPESRSYTLLELRTGVSETLGLASGGDAFAATIASGCVNP
jgi:hypothetical protein